MDSSPNFPSHSPTSVVYRIRVGGNLSRDWEDRMGSMRVVETHTTDNRPVTTLVGPVKDQADLLGVINTLHELHLPLLNLQTLDADSFEHQT